MSDRIDRILQASAVDESWRDLLTAALRELPPEYLDFLLYGSYLPGIERLLAPFSTMRYAECRYILFGQDPYPRKESAAGYAFIDGRVDRIFSPKGGLTSEVNRATSLRNFIKMLLVVRGGLECSDLSASAVAAADKRGMISTMRELRLNFEKAGVLLLNAAAVFEDSSRTRYHTAIWRAFTDRLLSGMNDISPRLILLGRHAAAIADLPGAGALQSLKAEHPYNISFICNESMHALFSPMRLLERDDIHI